MFFKKSDTILYPLIEQDGSYYVLDLSFKWPKLFLGVFYNIFATFPVYKADRESLITNSVGKKGRRKQNNSVLYAVIGTIIGKTLSKLNVGISPTLCLFVFSLLHLFLYVFKQKKLGKTKGLSLTHFKSRFVFNKITFAKRAKILIALSIIWMFQNGLFILTGYLFFASEASSNFGYFIMHCIWIIIMYLPVVLNHSGEIGKYEINKS